MLKQCTAAVVDDEDFEEDELLENLGKALKGGRYLMVLDGIWDINIDWYFKLKDKLKSVSGDGDGDGHVIITSRLPHTARMMVGTHNLYHLQLPSTSIQTHWQSKHAPIRNLLRKYRFNLEDELIERCDGLPFAIDSLAEVIKKHILGTE